jgi:hypothetical protein
MLLVYRIWKETCNAEALSRRLDNWQVRPEKKIAKLYKYLLTAKARGATGNTLYTSLQIGLPYKKNTLP